VKLRILIGYDGGERSRDALEFARRRAGGLTADRSVAAGLKPHPLRAHDLGSNDEPRAQRFDEIFYSAAEQRGAPQCDRHELTGPSTARQLMRLAEHWRADLLVVGSSHRGRLGRIYPGSVSAALLSGASCPVAVVPRGFATIRPTPIEVIGVGFDTRPEAALQFADDLALGLKATLELIAVSSFRPPLSEELAHPLDVRAVERDRLTAATASAASATTADVSVAEILDGDPADELAERSGRLDLIVVGSRGYGPLGSVLLGGVGTRLIRSAACPVIVVPSAPSEPAGAERSSAAEASP
jgi:nucleotide-binding universal stress UspA family protein